MKFTRVMEEQVTWCPRPLRLKVAREVQTMPTILRTIRMGVKHIRVLGSTLTPTWTRLQFVTPSSIFVRTTDMVVGVLSRVLGS